MQNNAKNYCRSFSKPDERRDFQGHGYLEVINFPDGTVVGRGTFEPGWRWTNDVKPIAGTSSCEASHDAYVLSGQMRIRMNNGDEFVVRAGDTFHIPGGHDAWVEGNERCVILDFAGFKHYAQRPTSQAA